MEVDIISLCFLNLTFFGEITVTSFFIAVMAIVKSFLVPHIKYVQYLPQHQLINTESSWNIKIFTFYCVQNSLCIGRDFHFSICCWYIPFLSGRVGKELIQSIWNIWFKSCKPPTLVLWKVLFNSVGIVVWITKCAYIYLLANVDKNRTGKRYKSNKEMTVSTLWNYSLFPLCTYIDKLKMN